MSRRTRTMAVVLSSAALLGAGAPAGALAHGGGHHDGSHDAKSRGHDPGLGRVAASLGVTKAQLKAALKTVGEQQKAAAKPASSKAAHEAFVAALAQQLGVPADKVAAAFERKHHHR
jgi:hypothetical protein